MRAVSALVLCLSLAACATPRIPADGGSASVTPVSLRDLRGVDDVLIFPEIDVPAAFAGAERYVATCLPTARRENDRSGFSIYRGGRAPYLTVKVASVSESSALGIGGVGLTPDLKEALAATVQGRPRCAG